METAHKPRLWRVVPAEIAACFVGQGPCASWLRYHWWWRKLDALGHGRRWIPLPEAAGSTGSPTLRTQRAGAGCAMGAPCDTALPAHTAPWSGVTRQGYTQPHTRTRTYSHTNSHAHTATQPHTHRSHRVAYFAGSGWSDHGRCANDDGGQCVDAAFLGHTRLHTVHGPNMGLFCLGRHVMLGG